jgi:hypothetical protein
VPKQGNSSTETLKRIRSEDSTPTERAGPSRRPRDSMGPGSFKKALTSAKIAIFKETYTKDTITKHDQDIILEELDKALRGTPVGELPHLMSYRLEKSALIYVCADHQSGQWLIRAIDNYRLGTETILKATVARNLPKPVKVLLEQGIK